MCYVDYIIIWCAVVCYVDYIVIWYSVMCYIDYIVIWHEIMCYADSTLLYDVQPCAILYRPYIVIWFAVMCYVILHCYTVCGDVLWTHILKMCCHNALKMLISTNELSIIDGQNDNKQVTNHQQIKESTSKWMRSMFDKYNILGTLKDMLLVNSHDATALRPYPNTSYSLSRLHGVWTQLSTRVSRHK